MLIKYSLGIRFVKRDNRKILMIIFFPFVLVAFLCKKLAMIVYRMRLSYMLGRISIEQLDSLDGHEFEELLYIVFAAMGYKVVKTKKSRDYGADLLVTIKDSCIAIQAKLYYKHSVGNSAIQQISSARAFYGATHAVVITNSHFTKPAISMAKALSVALIDKDNLSALFANNQSKRKVVSELLHNFQDTLNRSLISN